jgi:thiol-disulfide isomerase/thioredoxin
MVRWTVVIVVAGLLAAACGNPYPEVESPVGDMTDTSYYGQRGSVSRPNARGEMVAYEQFAGQFIWADYAAPWCQPCEPQTQDVKAVDDSFGPEVVFFTVMTSDMEGYGDPATVETAARWASRFGLDPGRVLAADLTAMTIPKNLLFSPKGHLLFEKTGQMRAAEIRDVLQRYMADWRNWEENAKVADWMRFGGD